MSLAFDQRAICFIPSVSALIALRERRLPRSRHVLSTLKRWLDIFTWRNRERHLEQLAWRPKQWFDFAVWFDRELPAEAEALARVAQRGAQLAHAHGLAHDAVDGKDATGDRLLDGLARADIARIACHGRFLPDAEAIDLLVAADGYLPPADLTELTKVDAHVLGWQRLAELSRAPAAVFSSACDSGLTTVNAGGERIGLERPLFTAGSVVYVAPLWPVPTAAIQDVVAQVIDRWLADHSQSLAAHVAATRSATAALRVPELAAKSLGVFGDGL